jgi:hypothetical protein
MIQPGQSKGTSLDRPRKDVIMNKKKPLDRSIHRTSWFALAAILLLTSAAQGMYDPHHGRWFQRDPLGVRPDRGNFYPSAVSKKVM